ncbi:MAG: hypothetical protein Q9169_007136 [Polycauliona sp. 2 TL-2023]
MYLHLLLLTFASCTTASASFYPLQARDASFNDCADSGCSSAGSTGISCFAPVGDIDDYDNWDDSQENAKQVRDCICGSDYWLQLSRCRECLVTKNLYPTFDPEIASEIAPPISVMSTSFCEPDGNRYNTKTIDGWMDYNTYDIGQINRMIPITTIPTDVATPTGTGGDVAETVNAETVFDSLISAAATETGLVSAIGSASPTSGPSAGTASPGTTSSAVVSSTATDSGSPTTSTSSMASETSSSTVGAPEDTTGTEESVSSAGSAAVLHTCSYILAVRKPAPAAHTIAGKPGSGDGAGPNYSPYNRWNVSDAMLETNAPKTNVSRGLKEQSRMNMLFNIQGRKAFSVTPSHGVLLITYDPASKDASAQGNGSDEAAQLLEQLMDESTDATTYSSTIGHLDPPLVTPDRPNAFWLASKDQQRQAMQFTMLRDIVDALPELDMIRLLNQIFVIRPQLMLGLAFHPSPSQHGWVSTPLTRRVEELRSGDCLFRTLRSLAIRCLQGDITFFCGSIASLQAAIMLLLDRHEEDHVLDAILVTAISGAQKLGLHRLGDAKLTYVEVTSPSTPESTLPLEPTIVRTKIGVRIWWSLVMKDWSRGLSQGYHNIHPSQFNTRLPLHINDNDLCSASDDTNGHGVIGERPRSEFTDVSYTIFALEIAALARECIDLCGSLRPTQGQKHVKSSAAIRTSLNEKYEDFLAGLPSHFRLGSSAGLDATGPPTGAIPVHRWMIHQQIWSLFLRLHRAGLSSHEGQIGSQLLAQNIIGTQAQILARCTVCGTLSTNKGQVFNAAVLLVVDLLFNTNSTTTANRSGAQLSRLMRRSKIEEAMGLLNTADHPAATVEGERLSAEPHSEPWEAPARKNCLILRELLKIEEEIIANGRTNGTNPTNRGGGKRGSNTDIDTKQSILNKIKNVLASLKDGAQDNTNGTQGSSHLSMSASEARTPAPPAPLKETHEMDVLPVLFNSESDDDMWQFLNFDPPLPAQQYEGGTFRF